MYYKLPLYKINKLFNPFNENSTFIGSQHVIKDLINRNDIFVNDLYKDFDEKNQYDSENNKEYKILAYEVANYEPKEIVINLSQENIIEVENIITEGLLNLYAAFYFYNEDKLNDIIVKIEGDERVIQSLLGNDIGNYVTDERVEKNSTIQIVSFDIEENFIEDQWENIDFVIKELDKQNYSITDEIFKFIVPSIWENKEFIKKVCETKKALDNASHHLLNNSLYELIRDENNFSYYWKKLLETKRGMIQDSVEYIAIKAQKKSENYSLIENRSFEEETQYRYSKRTIFLYKMKQEFFENIDNLCILLKDEKINIHPIYENLSEEVKFNERVLDILYNEELVNPHFFLEEKQYGDYDFMKNFLIKYAKHMEFERIFSFAESSSQIKDFDKIISSFKKDKEKVLELLTTINDSNFTRIYCLLDSDLKEDKDIIKMVLSIDINLYVDVPLELRQEYKKDFILNGSSKFIKSHCFSFEEIYNIEEKSLLMEIVKKGNSSWLKDIYCPAKWQKDNDFLNEIDDVSDFSKVSSSHPIFETMIKNRNFLLKVLKCNKSFFFYLPESLKDDKEVFNFMLSTHEHVENKHFSNKKLCLEIMKKNPQYVNKVPVQFWYEKDFLVEIGNAIDEKKIQKNILQYAPKKLVQLLTAFEVNSNYEDFFSNYFLHQKLNDSTQEKIIIKKKKI